MVMVICKRGALKNKPPILQEAYFLYDRFRYGFTLSTSACRAVLMVSKSKPLAAA